MRIVCSSRGSRVSVAEPNSLLSHSYNYTYPASEAVEVDGTVIRRFATVADMDKRSRDQSNTEGEWLSRLTYGKLVYDSGTKTYRCVSLPLCIALSLYY